MEKGKIVPHGPPGCDVVVTFDIPKIRRSQTWPFSFQNVSLGVFRNDSLDEELEEGGPGPDVADPSQTQAPQAVTDLLVATGPGRSNSSGSSSDYNAEILKAIKKPGSEKQQIAIGRIADFLVRSTASKEVVWRRARCIDIKEDNNLALFEVDASIHGGTALLHWLSLSELPFRVSYPSGLRSRPPAADNIKVFFATNRGESEEDGGVNVSDVSKAIGEAHSMLPSRTTTASTTSTSAALKPPKTRVYATARAKARGSPVPDDAILDTLGPLEIPRLQVFYKPNKSILGYPHSVASEEIEDISLLDHSFFIHLRPGNTIAAFDIRTGEWKNTMVLQLITDSPALRWVNVEQHIGRGGVPSPPILIAVIVSFVQDGHSVIIPLSRDALRPTSYAGLPLNTNHATVCECMLAIRLSDPPECDETNLDLFIERAEVKILGVGIGPEVGVRIKASNSPANDDFSVVESWRLRKIADKTPNAYYNVVEEPKYWASFLFLLKQAGWEVEPVVSSSIASIARPDNIPGNAFFAEISKVLFDCKCHDGALMAFSKVISQFLLSHREEFTQILRLWSNAAAEAERAICVEAHMSSKMAREYWTRPVEKSASLPLITAKAKAMGGESASPLHRRHHIPGTELTSWPDIDHIAVIVAKGGFIPISALPTFLNILIVRGLLGCKLELFHSGATLLSGQPSFSSCAPQVVNEMAMKEEDSAVSQAPSRQLICGGCGSHAKPTLFAALAQISPTRWSLLARKLPDYVPDMPGSSYVNIGDDLPTTPTTPPIEQNTESLGISDIVTRFARSPLTPSLLYEIALDEMRSTLAIEIHSSVVRAIASKKIKTEEEEYEDLDDDAETDDKINSIGRD